MVKFDFDGNERRGLTAKCRLPDGSQYTVSAADIGLPAGDPREHYIAAYRKWMGLPPERAKAAARVRKESVKPSLDEGAIELVVLAVQKLAVRCRTLAGGERITLRAKRFWDLAPGEVVSVRPNKQWSYAGNPYLSGAIEARRIDAAALSLTPLRLESRGIWDPAEEYWGEDGDPVEDSVKPIIARGPRPQFEMQQVLPGEDPGDPFSDPITESNDRKDAGDLAGAEKLLTEGRGMFRGLVAGEIAVPGQIPESGHGGGIGHVFHRIPDRRRLAHDGEFEGDNGIYQDLEAEAARVPIGSHGLLTVPYWGSVMPVRRASWRGVRPPSKHRTRARECARLWVRAGSGTRRKRPRR